MILQDIFQNTKRVHLQWMIEKLADQNIHRLGNALVPMESYGPLIEEKVQEILKMHTVKEKRNVNCRHQQRIRKAMGEDSFFIGLYKNDIPVVVPE